MVKEIIKGKSKYYCCEECGVVYAEKEWAQKCENWCSEHHSCNIEIIKHAVKEEKSHG
jgi:hypothetical protein